MTELALVGAAFAMGLAGLPHCAAMCAAPCAAVTRGVGSAQLGFALARVAGYAGAGAVAALGVGALREGLAQTAALRPLWTMLHLAALALGLWLAFTGRWPAALNRPVRSAAAPAGWQRIALPARSACAGAAWIAWPCALSQSALLVAALADSAGGGAAAMTAFALASTPALVVGPWLAARVRRGRGAVAVFDAQATWPLRAGGVLVAAGSAWALGHGLAARALAWCFGA